MEIKLISYIDKIGIIIGILIVLIMILMLRSYAWIKIIEFMDNQDEDLRDEIKKVRKALERGR